MIDAELEESLAGVSIGNEKPWTLQKAVLLCRVLEIIAPLYGAHVSLSGGCLYKDGPRKDCDVHFYRIRQVPAIDEDGLLEALKGIGIEIGERYGWVIKAHYRGDPIDLFFPEYKGNGGTRRSDGSYG